MQKAIPLLLMSAVQSARKHREHTANIYRVLIGPTTSSIQAAQQQNEIYHKATVGQSGHGLGSPAPLAWAVYVVSRVEKMLGATLTQANVPEAPGEWVPVFKVIRQFLLAPEGGDETALKRARLQAKEYLKSRITTFKVEDISNGNVRIQMRFTDELLESATQHMMCDEGLEVQHGPAPPDGLERSIKALLDNGK